MRRLGDRGFTMVELLIVVGLLAVIAALVVPALSRARIAANEASAIAGLRVTAAAQKAYLSTCGAGAYAADFLALGRPGPNGEAPFISDNLGRSITPAQSGYVYSLGRGAGATAGPDDCHGSPTTTVYYATAVPASFGSSGTRSFAVTSLSTIWQVAAATAPSEPFGPPATTIE